MNVVVRGGKRADWGAGLAGVENEAGEGELSGHAAGFVGSFLCDGDGFLVGFRGFLLEFRILRISRPDVEERI